LDSRTDTIIAGLFVLLGLGMIATAVTFPPVAIEYDPIGPMGLPLGVGIFFVAAGGFQAWQSTKQRRKYGRYVPAEGDEDEKGHPSSPARALAFMVGALAYVGLLVPLGYLLTTIAFVAGALWLMEIRPAWKVLTAATIFGVVAFFSFRELLGIPLPTGILAGLLDGV
jgi:putative tricarboxylic transport membrane protein